MPRSRRTAHLQSEFQEPGKEPGNLYLWFVGLGQEGRCLALETWPTEGLAGARGPRSPACLQLTARPWAAGLWAWETPPALPCLDLCGKGLWKHQTRHSTVPRSHKGPCRDHAKLAGRVRAGLGQEGDRDRQVDVSEPHVGAPGSARWAFHLLPSFGSLPPSSSASDQQGNSIWAEGPACEANLPEQRGGEPEGNQQRRASEVTCKTLAFILGDSVLGEWCPQSCPQAHRLTHSGQDAT